MCGAEMAHSRGRVVTCCCKREHRQAVRFLYRVRHKRSVTLLVYLYIGVSGSTVVTHVLVSKKLENEVDDGGNSLLVHELGDSDQGCGDLREESNTAMQGVVQAWRGQYC